LLEVWPNLDVLADRFGWPIGEVRTILAYTNDAAVFRFPTCAEFGDLFSAAGFRVVREWSPDYELGDRCPTFALRRERTVDGR
jgi:hypothetical protein